MGPSGNASLQPEESVSWDVGIDQQLFDGQLQLSATYFSLNTDNLIDFVFGSGYVTVPGTTRRSGVEISAQAQLADWISTSATYTYTDARKQNGDRLVRAPRHIVTLGLDVQPIDKLSFVTTAKIVKDTVDVSGVRLDDYVLLNSKLSYELTEQFSAYVRGENLLDKEYQTINGFGTSDRAVYVGLQLKLPE